MAGDGVKGSRDTDVDNNDGGAVGAHPNRRRAIDVRKSKTGIKNILQIAPCHPRASKLTEMEAQSRAVKNADRLD